MKKKLANYLAAWNNMLLSASTVHYFLCLMLLGSGVIVWKISGEASFWHLKQVQVILCVACLLCAHGILVAVLAPFFISKNEWGSQYWELIRVRDGRVFVLENRALPRTGCRYIIKKPHNYCDGISEAKFSTYLSIKLRNSKITIPVVIKFKMKSMFDVTELFTVLFNAQGPGPDYDFHKYVINYFMKINANSMPRIKELIIDYANSKISEPEVLNSVVELLTFPERPFIGVEKVTLRLGDPEIIVRKGQGCEN